MPMDAILIRAESYNVPAPGAATNILTTSLTPKFGGAFRVTVCLATGSVFNVTITKASNTFTCGLNGGTALTAGMLYTFSFGVSTLQSYNFQVATNGIIQVLQVDEVDSGVL